MKNFIKILLTGLFFPIFSFAQPKHEIRAVWLTSLYNLDWPTTQASDIQGIQKQQQELCNILDKISAAHFNTVLFQTRLRGDVIYPSRIEPFNECLTGKKGKSPGYDPLQFAIEECHKRNLELHAWIVTIPLGGSRHVRQQGRSAVAKNHPALCRLYHGNWYMDPGHPETKQYLSRLVMEVVDNYDIDGVHLDYIRYPEKAPNFPDNASYRQYGKGKSKPDWRRDNITGIVRDIYHNVKSKKPWVKVSSSPVGKYNDTRRYSSKGWNALHTVNQDVQLWMRQGIQDLIFPMMYFKDNDFFPFALDWNENKSGRFVVPGLGVYFLDEKERTWQLDDIMKQLYFIRNQHLDGVAFFRSRFIVDNTKDILQETTSHFFSYPAFIPAMTWNDSIAPTPPITQPIQEDNSYIYLKWDASTNSDGTPVSYRIYASDHYPVNTDRPQNIVCQGTPQTVFTLSKTDTRSQRLYWAVTASDRYGNESEACAFNTAALPCYSICSTDDITLRTGTTLVIYNIAGKEIMRISSQDRGNLQLLNKGIYRITTIDDKGRHTDSGIMVK